MGLKSLLLSANPATAKQVYLPGDVVSGFCDYEIAPETGIFKCNAQNDRKPIELVISLQGISKVRWTETRTVSTGKSTSTYVVVYSSRREIVSLEQRVRLTTDEQLARGSHRVPYSFTLPTNGLKTSFEGAHGYIRYSVDAKPDASWLASLFKPKAKPLAFAVVEQVSIDSAEQLRRVGGSNTKSACCLFLKSGPMTIDAETDHGAYYSLGDIATVTAEFSNLSSRKVKPYIKLVQTCVFVADGGKANPTTKRFDVELVNPSDTSVMDTVLKKGGSANWNSIAFKLPPVMPSIYADNITVAYHLEVAMEIPWAINLRVKLPVVLGTIPRSLKHQEASGKIGNAVTFEEAPPSYFASMLLQQVPVLPEDNGDETESVDGKAGKATGKKSWFSSKK